MSRLNSSYWLRRVVLQSVFQLPVYPTGIWFFWQFIFNPAAALRFPR
jgi:hypothetical protein